MKPITGQSGLIHMDHAQPKDPRQQDLFDKQAHNRAAWEAVAGFLERESFKACVARHVAATTREAGR